MGIIHISKLSDNLIDSKDYRGSEEEKDMYSRGRLKLYN